MFDHVRRVRRGNPRGVVNRIGRHRCGDFHVPAAEHVALPLRCSTFCVDRGCRTVAHVLEDGIGEDVLAFHAISVGDGESLAVVVDIEHQAAIAVDGAGQLVQAVAINMLETCVFLDRGGCRLAGRAA